MRSIFNQQFLLPIGSSRDGKKPTTGMSLQWAGEKFKKPTAALTVFVGLQLLIYVQQRPKHL
jgi:hypothetical protein